MNTCQVCQTSFTMGKASRNYDFEGFCSRYCYEFDRQNLTKETKLFDKSAVVHESEIWPQIPVKCQTCNKDFNLKRSHTYYRNSWFCGRECLNAIENLSRGMRNYHYLLPLQKTQEWMSAKEVGYHNRHRVIDSRSSRSIGMVLKLWASRGVLKVDKSTTPFVYLWNYNGPVGNAMLNYK